MRSLTVFFNFDKVYGTVFNRTNRGLELLDVFSTLDPIDLENIEDELSQKGINQLNRELKSLKVDNIEELNVIFNNKNALWSSIPGDVTMNNKDLKKLIEVELKDKVGSTDVSPYLFKIYPFGENSNEESNMTLALMIERDVIENCKKILDITGLEISYYTIAQIAAQNTIEYNYPEAGHLVDIVINMEDNFCDISAGKSNVLFYYDLIKNDNNEEFEENIIKKILDLKEKGISIGDVFLYGTNLNKEFLDNLSESMEKLDLELYRINSFRFVRSKLDKRIQDYCIRTAHIYAPAVGGALNGYDKGHIVEF